MPRKGPDFKKARRESFFSFPRILALVSICGFAVSPFLPWLRSGAEADALTLRELTGQLVQANALSVNLWPVPIAFAIIFLLPLLADLRTLRAVYYLLIIELVVAAIAFLYPNIPGILLQAGLTVQEVGAGFYLFMAAFALLAWSAISTLWQSRLGIAVLVLMIIFTAVIIGGYLTSWFGYLTGEPKVWSEQHEATTPDGDALGVRLNVLNEGWGAMKLALPSKEKTREIDYVISAQRYYRVGEYWADVPFVNVLEPESQEQLPTELKPGGFVELELTFRPLTRAADMYAFPVIGASGTYRILITDPAGKPVTEHRIDVPLAAEEHT
ncbi:MAG: hypothetical protein Kow0099_03820 [Candidatus Abyssubacteria bacterium]